MLFSFCVLLQSQWSYKKETRHSCSRLTLSKQLGRYYKINAHCVFHCRCGKFKKKIIYILRQETKIRLEEYFS